MSRLADALLWLHWAFLLVMATAPAWAPWQAIAAVGGVVLLVNSLNGMRCPLTQHEYRLRRRDLTDRIHPLAAFPSASDSVSVGDVIANLRGDRFLVKEVAYAGKHCFVTVTPYLPSQSAMRRLFALCGVTVSEATVAQVFAWSLATLPLAAWVRFAVLGW
jgi:hypothetical protein